MIFRNKLYEVLNLLGFFHAKQLAFDSTVIIGLPLVDDM